MKFEPAAKTRIDIRTNRIVNELDDHYSRIKLNEVEAEMWVFTMEDAIFTLAINELNLKKPFQNFTASDIISSETEPKILILLKKYNELLEEEPEKFGMKIKVQAYSHIMLMKLCLCIIAFEVAKRNHK